MSALGGQLFVDSNPSLPPGAEKSLESNLDRVLVEINPSLLGGVVGKFVETGLGIFLEGFVKLDIDFLGRPLWHAGKAGWVTGLAKLHCKICLDFLGVAMAVHKTIHN